MSSTDTVTGTDVVVPGSISNLGPGFDALSIAVQLYLRVRIVEVLPDEPGLLHCDFVGAPLVGENRIQSAFAYAAEAFGRPAPGLRLEVRNEIPVRAGLGSSAAAIVAGLRLYGAVVSPAPQGEWLRLACRLEGHPDNAAAALAGGMVVSCELGDGRVTARTWPWPAEIRLVVATPDVEIATGRARGVLPAVIPLRDAVFNLQHALLLVHAVTTGRPADLREALRDRWHQPARMPMVPGLAEALALEHPSLFGTCLSGSGPSIVAFAGDGTPAVVELMKNLYERLGVPCTVRVLQAHQPETSAGRPSASPCT